MKIFDNVLCTIRNALRNAIRKPANLLAETLREIFDENAYARFLTRNALPNSQSSYAEFLRQESHHRERRPRCC
jgi:hypothetical protein